MRSTISSRSNSASAAKMPKTSLPEAVVALAGGEVLVEVIGADAGGEQRVALQVEDLRAVRLRDARVADQHATQTSGQVTDRETAAA